MKKPGNYPKPFHFSSPTHLVSTSINSTSWRACKSISPPSASVQAFILFLQEDAYCLEAFLLQPISHVVVRAIFLKSSIWLYQGLESLQYPIPCPSVKPRLLIMIKKKKRSCIPRHSVPFYLLSQYSNSSTDLQLREILHWFWISFAFLSPHPFAYAVFLCLECPSPCSLPS